MNIQGAIFDLDGTLIDSMGVWARIDVDFLARRGIEVPADYIASVSPLSFLEAAKYTIQRFSLDEQPEALTREWHDMAIYEYRNTIALKPHAEAYLARIRQAGVRMAIATSSPPELHRAVLESTGIAGYFDAVCCVSEVSRGKSFPDLFLHAADKLGVSPERCCVYEDLLQAIKSAKSVGMTVFAVYDDSGKAHWEEAQRIADQVIYRFEQAPLP